MFLLSASAAFALAGGASAWLTSGHRHVAVDAIRILPPEVPAFFRAKPDDVGLAAVDPDYWKILDAPALGDGERPHHYLDVELLDGAPLPRLRSDYRRLLARKGLDESRVGMLPYSILEGLERLTLCFAQWRRRPGVAGVEAKCRVFAGELAHYAADLEQPLHTSIHHDGWALPTGDPPFSGIHMRVDGLFLTVDFDAMRAAACATPRRLGDPWATILSEFAASHALVDRVYALEPKLPATSGESDDAEIVAFTEDRYRATVELLSSLFLTAWEDSARVNVPSWALP